MIRHLVFLNFASNISHEARKTLMCDLAALRDEIDGFESFSARPNISPEAAFIHGMTEMFWIDFRDAEARDAYVENPIHKAIGARIMASLEGGADGILVCDVEL